MIFLGIISESSVAQISHTESTPDWQKEVYKTLRKDKASYVFKDSIAMYTFNFKIEIIKSKGNKTRIGKFIVSDTLLYQLFPSYKELYAIDYSSLLKGRNKINLVVPILVYNVSPTGQNKYQKQDKQYLVNIETAMDIARNSLISLMSKNKFEDIILLNPVVIKILNLKDKEPVLLKN